MVKFLRNLFMILGCAVLLGGTVFNAMAAPALDSNKPIDIAADALEVRQLEKLAIFSGNVIATQGNISMKSARMQVYYNEGGTDAPEQSSKDAASISKIEADGGVFFATPSETARSDKAIYDVSKEQIRMIGNVTLTRDSSVLKGAGLVYNLKTGRSLLTSGDGSQSPQGGDGQRVRGLFVPKPEGQ